MIATFMRFTKIEHTAFSLPMLFAGAWMGGGQAWPSASVLGLIVVAATGARLFGMSCNRVFDRHIDARNPRTAARELPSGKLSVQTALVIAMAGLIVYIAACVALGPWCAILAPVPLIPLLGYSLLKRYTFLCHFGIGLCLALAPLGAFVAAAGHPFFTAGILFFAAFVFFWLSGADIIYALMDIDSDRQNGIHSLPAKLGNRRAQYVAAAAHILSLTCLAWVLRLSGVEMAGAVAFGVTALLYIAMYLPFIPVPTRFFPLATLAGMAGAVTPLV